MKNCISLLLFFITLLKVSYAQTNHTFYTNHTVGYEQHINSNNWTKTYDKWENCSVYINYTNKFIIFRDWSNKILLSFKFSVDQAEIVTKAKLICYDDTNRYWQIVLDYSDKTINVIKDEDNTTKIMVFHIATGASAY